MATPFPRALSSAARKGWERLRHRAFLGSLRVFDAWMGAPENRRETFSILGAISAALLTILAFGFLFGMSMRGLWTGGYPFLKQMAFLAPDVAFAGCLTVSGMLLCFLWKLMLRSMEAVLQLLHPDNQLAWMNQATDSFLIQRMRRFEKVLLTCSPLERRIADRLWQEERVVRAKAGILEVRLAPVPEAEEAPKRARL